MGAGRQGRERARKIAPAETRQAAPYVRSSPPQPLRSGGLRPRHGVRRVEGGGTEIGDRRAKSHRSIGLRSPLPTFLHSPFLLTPHPITYYVFSLRSVLFALFSSLFSLFSFLTRSSSQDCLLDRGSRDLFFSLPLYSSLFSSLISPRATARGRSAKWRAGRKCGLRIAGCARVMCDA